MRYLWVMRFGLLFTLGCVFLFSGKLHSGSSKPQGGFRIHLQMGNDTQTTSQTVAIPLSDPEETISVSVVPDMSENQIAQIRPLPHPNGDLGMMVIFDKRGTTMLSYLTNQAQGRIMVVYLNNRIVYSPSIDTVISDGVLIIPSGVTPQDIESLQAIVKKLTSE